MFIFQQDFYCLGFIITVIEDYFGIWTVKHNRFSLISTAVGGICGSTRESVLEEARQKIFDATLQVPPSYFYYLAYKK